MTSLARDLRKDLEKTVKQARRVAEAGARKAVEQLGVGEGDAPKHLTPGQRGLRNRLRAHGRQLGDRRDAKAGTQATSRLVQECAYEHWHRMLFARFLAETDLLIEPDSGVAITLDEVRELAHEKSADWLELASNYAERMLPQIFRKGDPVLDIALPPETRSELEDLLKKLPRDVFQADDSLGWVYQFWQAEKKDEINQSGTKIGAEELPAVTQLFTEDYMVLFLLHNTLGAWWAGKVLAASPELAASAKNEDDLRVACKVGGVDWTYLRFVRDDGDDGAHGPWRPAAGLFEGWPRLAKDVTVLDPCMGSGHFLAFALPILVAFRMAEEKLSPQAAIDAVLRENLFGLEIDSRCTQIAAFNLAFAAWRMVRYRPLPRLNLACSGLAIGVTKADWLKLAERAAELADPAAKRDIFGLEKSLITSGISERAKNGLEALYDLFAKAPWLGSLIDLRRADGNIFRADFAQLEPLMAPIMTAAATEDVTELAVVAQGVAKAAELMARQFTLVATNVPYLGRAKMDATLGDFVDDNFKFAKADLSTVFLERNLNYCAPYGTSVTVTPQNWWFLGSYRRFRERIIASVDVLTLVDLGPAAFEVMNWWAAQTTLQILSKPCLSKNTSCYDAAAGKWPAEKSKNCLTATAVLRRSVDFLAQPDCRLAFGSLNQTAPLSESALSLAGILNGDTPRFIRKFWELPHASKEWAYQQTTVEDSRTVGGLEQIIFYDSDSGHLREEASIRRDKLHDSDQRGNAAWGRRGIAISQMRTLPVALYYGEKFDSNVAVVVPKDDALLPALWCFFTSEIFIQEIRNIEKKLNVTNSTFGKVPFDHARWNKIAADKFQNGLATAYSSEPTQWIFNGYPAGASNPIQVAACRALGYAWPRQTGSSFIESPNILTDGLEAHSDNDGIVCLTAIKGEPPAEQRLNALLADAFGSEWSAAKLASLLAEVDFDGKTLDDWLREGFFQQHCELFHQRPFVWHIWDGRRDGFHALVNYHRLAAPDGEGRRTLEKIIYSYLGDWIDRQRTDQKSGIEGADGRLAAAEHLRAELTKILEGEPPYDIFVRWKPLHEQPMGWEPDINDGVRMNVRPFVTARPLGAKSASACILRARPKSLKWDKDRGKEPVRDKTDYPWLWSWDRGTQDFGGLKDFDGNRWNDLHYTRAAKQAARDRHRIKARGKE